MSMVRHEKTFYLHGGKKFSSLKGLAKELRDMSHDVFSHHVSNVKNDFSKWVKHSLKDDKLAEKIEKKLHKVEMELEVLRHMVHESAETAKKTVKTTVKKATKTVEKKADTPKKKPATKKAKK